MVDFPANNVWLPEGIIVLGLDLAVSCFCWWGCNTVQMVTFWCSACGSCEINLVGIISTNNDDVFTKKKGERTDKWIRNMKIMNTHAHIYIYVSMYLLIDLFSYWFIYIYVIQDIYVCINIWHRYIHNKIKHAVYVCYYIHFFHTERCSTQLSFFHPLLHSDIFCLWPKNQHCWKCTTVHHSLS